LRKQAPPLAIVFLLIVTASMSDAAGQGISKLYVSNSEGDDITVIDLTTYAVIGNIRVGEQVHGLCAPSDGRRLFTTIESENNLKVIDTRSDKVVDTIPLTGRPNQCASTPDGRYVGVPIRSTNSVDIVDTTERKVVKVLPVARLEPHTPTHGLELSPDGKELWVTSLADSGVYVYDVATNHIATEIPVGKCPNWITFSPNGRYGAVSNSDSDDSSIIDTRTRREVARVKVGKSPKRLLAVTVP
jgi:YVTN family beta-propeller protein